MPPQGQIGGVWFTWLHGDVSAADNAAVVAHGEAYATTTTPAAYLFVIKATPPTAPQRRDLADVLTRVNANTACRAMIIDSGSPFVRGMLTAISWVTRPRAPIKVFASLREGLDWLATLDIDVDAPAITARLASDAAFCASGL
jgi:hypothetical protein